MLFVFFSTMVQPSFLFFVFFKLLLFIYLLYFVFIFHPKIEKLEKKRAMNVNLWCGDGDDKFVRSTRENNTQFIKR